MKNGLKPSFNHGRFFDVSCFQLYPHLNTFKDGQRSFGYSNSIPQHHTQPRYSLHLYLQQQPNRWLWPEWGRPAVVRRGDRDQSLYRSVEDTSLQKDTHISGSYTKYRLFRYAVVPGFDSNISPAQWRWRAAGLAVRFLQNAKYGIISEY